MNRIFIVTSVSSVAVRVAAGGRPYTCPAMAKQSGEKLIVDNRRARHDYHLSDRVEAGVVLTGTEVKSLRGGEATLQQAYAEVRDGEAWLVGLTCPSTPRGTAPTTTPTGRASSSSTGRRSSGSLRRSLRRASPVVPTRLYFRDGRVKVELALARGKELRDKRRDIAARDAQRQIERELKSLRR
jgi:SsrA-binding protein